MREAIRSAGPLTDTAVGQQDEVLGRHADRALRGTDADLALLVGLDAEGAAVEALACRTARPFASGHRLPDAAAALWTMPADGRASAADDATADAGAQALAQVLDHPVGAWAAVAVATVDGRVLGALLVVRPAPRAWEADALGVLVGAGEAIQTELRLRTALQTQQRLRDRLETQHTIHGLIAERAPLGTLLEQVALALRRQCPGMRGAVRLLDEPGGRRHRAGAAPGLPADWARPLPAADDDAEADAPPVLAARTGSEVLVADGPSGRSGPGHEGGRPPRSCWSVPVLGRRGTVLGSVSLVGDLGRLPTAAELELLHDAARLTALALREDEASRDMITRATRDALTGLPNRAWLSEHLALRLRAVTPEVPAIVMFCDLDRFKLINDSLGHEVGDEVLRAVADRLSGALRAEDAVARFGGDEFVVVPSNIHSEPAAGVLAARMSAAVGDPIHDARGVVHAVGLSIGIAVVGDPGVSPEEALRRADSAMYQAKRDRSAVRVYEPAVDRRRTDDLHLADELRLAVDAGALHLAFQPIVATATGLIVALEALLRWDRRDGPPVGPDRFIPVAEEHGLIDEIGGWVVDRALAVVARMRAELAWAPTMCVNLSGRQLAGAGFPVVVARLLAHHEVPGESLVFEVTETALLGEEREAVRILSELVGFGATVVLDDFGTGYSSLTHLRRLPITALKVDRSFVDGLGVDRNDTAIVEGIVGLGRGLGLSLTAEGVETADQAARLVALGCERAQGYHFARPLALDALWPLLESGRPLGIAD